MTVAGTKLHHKAQWLCMWEEMDGSSLGVSEEKGRQKLFSSLRLLSSGAQRSGESAEKGSQGISLLRGRAVKRKGGTSYQLSLSCSFVLMTDRSNRAFILGPVVSKGTYNCTQCTYSSKTPAHLCLQGYLHIHFNCKKISAVDVSLQTHY